MYSILRVTWIECVQSHQQLDKLGFFLILKFNKLVGDTRAGMFVIWCVICVQCLSTPVLWSWPDHVTLWHGPSKWCWPILLSHTHTASLVFTIVNTHHNKVFHCWTLRWCTVLMCTVQRVFYNCSTELRTPAWDCGKVMTCHCH